jgi:NAD(P)-dependent dehydrogenase (short-subunit alcohol dehydrogenase family)
MARVLREGAFEGETHIVTGAAQGIGRAVATALAEHGAQVVLVDLDEGRLAEAASEIGKVAKVTPLCSAANVTWPTRPTCSAPSRRRSRRRAW